MRKNINAVKEVSIRLLKEEDAYVSVKWRNDPEVFRYTRTHYTEEITIKKELEWIRRVIVNKDEYRCAIIADDKYVGNIYLTGIDEESAHYHIFIGERDYWGRSVARRASELILNYAFATLGLSQVTLNVDKANESAIRLYKRLGFEQCGEDSNFLKMVCRCFV